MRIIILTTDNFASAVYMSKTPLLEGCEVVEVACSDAGLSRKWSTARFIRSVRKTDVRYALSRLAFGGTLRLSDKFCSVFRRGRVYSVAALANHYGVPVRYYARMNEHVAHFRELRPDLIVSVNVNQLLSEELIALPSIAAINIHGGLLPKYGGLSPFLWAIANGEPEVGMTIHHLSASFDTGDIITQVALPVQRPQSVYGCTYDGCIAGRELLAYTVRLIQRGEARRIAQDLAVRSYYKHPKPDDIRRLRCRGHSIMTIRDLVRFASYDLLREAQGPVEIPRFCRKVSGFS